MIFGVPGNFCVGEMSRNYKIIKGYCKIQKFHGYCKTWKFNG